MGRVVGFISLGCGKNQVNCEQMIWLAHAAGYTVDLGAEDCQIAVVNTCGFLQEAKAEALGVYAELAEKKRQGRLEKIVVAGCMPQRFQEELAALCPLADAFVGCSRYGDIVSVLRALETADEPLYCFGDIDAALPETERVVIGSEYWAWLRIAEGCDNHCAYCVIPSIRGRFRSRTQADILHEAEELAAAGIRELLVVAQDITRYGTDRSGRRELAELLEKLCRVEGIDWIRLHYLYPDEIDDTLLDVVAREEKIVKYLDIPIQHISDAVLRGMHRRGDGALLRRLFTHIREKIPGVTLRTSLICGFPGETEEDFEELCVFLREYRLPHAGIFAYSPEPQSAAAARSDQVEEAVKRERLALLTDLQAQMQDEVLAARLGQTVTVLCEGYDEETELWFGRSGAESPGIDGQIWFVAPDDAVEAGKFYPVTLSRLYDGELIGAWEEDEG